MLRYNITKIGSGDTILANFSYPHGDIGNVINITNTVGIMKIKNSEKLLKQLGYSPKF